MELYYMVVFFIFGLIFGSFFNVVAYRLPKGMSLIKPSSHCTKCNHKLSPIELIPVLSYIIQGGKCKNCKNKIAIFYPIFEIFTGVMFVIAYKTFGISIDLFINLIFISMILIIILSDVLYMVISDEVLIFCGLSIFILKILKSGISIILPTIINMIIPFVFLLLIKILGDFLFKKESMGFGDIKLMLVFGLVLGWQVTLFSIVLSCFIALPLSLINLIVAKKHELPFGPYLGTAALISLLLKIDVNFILKILGI